MPAMSGAPKRRRRPRGRAETRLRALVAIAIGAAAVSAAVGVTLAARSEAGSASTPRVPSGRLPGELTGPAPWPANNGTQLGARLASLGLPALAQEGTALHIHAHLDVFVNGRRVVVPAGIGIDPEGRFISPLHTHDATGIVHVESPTVRSFTLGEVFGVWGVRLNRRCVGGYCAGGGRVLRVYADGRPVSDPARLRLAAHDEIVVGVRDAAPAAPSGAGTVPLSARPVARRPRRRSSRRPAATATASTGLDRLPDDDRDDGGARDNHDDRARGEWRRGDHVTPRPLRPPYYAVSPDRPAPRGGGRAAGETRLRPSPRWRSA